MIFIDTKQLNAYGFSLIEVLISMFIITFGLLGITGIYICSLKRTEDAYWRTVATSQLITITEKKKICENFVFNSACPYLLPNCEYRYDNEKITICWGRSAEKNDEQCI